MIKFDPMGQPPPRPAVDAHTPMATPPPEADEPAPPPPDEPAPGGGGAGSGGPGGSGGSGAAMKLTLFVGHGSAATESAIAALRALVSEHPGRFELDVVNVNDHPEKAERHRIIATPTLIRELPPPVRRLVGDLSRRAEVRVALDIAAEFPRLLNADPEKGASE